MFCINKYLTPERMAVFNFGDLGYILKLMSAHCLLPSAIETELVDDFRDRMHQTSERTSSSEDPFNDGKSQAQFIKGLIRTEQYAGLWLRLDATSSAYSGHTADRRRTVGHL